MLRVVIVILFASLVGLILVNVLMVLNFFRRGGKWKIITPELLPLLFAGSLGKKYLDLLRHARLEPTGFDRLLQFFETGLKWALFGSAGLFILLLLMVMGD